MKVYAFSDNLNILVRLLEYPLAGSLEYLKNFDPNSISDNEAEKLIRKFLQFIGITNLDTVQELYATTFDLQPSCYPYIGYHLFGEDYRRGSFMAKLKEVYRDYKYDYNEKELPDHVSVVLGFLPRYDNEEERVEFIEFCLLPSVEKMEQGLSDGNPYKDPIRALLIILRKELSNSKKQGLPTIFAVK
ncbi:MAG TPA: nitrate reductase molybdenum cofactor assembly chaperone [bacterium]